MIIRTPNSIVEEGNGRGGGNKDKIPLHAEVNELIDGGIKSWAILLLCQQLQLLYNMHSPRVSQIWRVHVTNRIVNTFPFLKIRRFNVL